MATRQNQLNDYHPEQYSEHQCYVGQSGQTLNKRLVLHKSDAKLRPDRCALAQHVFSTGHNMCFDNVEILDTEKNLTKRKFLEMCYITQNNTMNSRTDVNNLSNIYSFLLTLDER
ncbi:hypothetical protein HHI36_000585 [Cryptolaemus montrouzieri]|uniref:GIY-YIG domain-containing protein n=1 Tax=Cryptolaemus montrouzieri TaxID=559131 RepID=A0ABD2P527_9CUCU